MILYTDGACSANGSAAAVGRFGVVVLDDNENIIELYNKQNHNTTNNREELRAILYALIKYGKQIIPPIVYSDSAYCVNTFTQWYLGWKENGWIKKDKRVPENLQLIKLYDIMYNVGKKINLKKIAGHNGHKYNELCDKLCTGKITIGELYE